MSSNLANGGVYTDFTGFSKLRADARTNAPEAVDKTARQFEALFTQMLLKSMRATSFGDDGLGSQGDMYKDMFDQQLSLSMSAGKGLGIADMLVQQLRRSQGAPAESAEPAPTVRLKAADHLSMTMREPVPAVPDKRESASGPGTGVVRMPTLPADTQPTTKPERPLGRREFLAAIWPHAQRAAKAIGIDPQALVAQAALETGWGKHLPRGADGQPSFNLFGIKADRSWSGARASSVTHEVTNGVLERKRADFRNYESIGQAFDDYVSFLRSNPRYAEALRHGGDSRRFAAGLQKAGYATDPQYADKIQRIADSPVLQRILAGLRPGKSLSV